MRTHVLALVAVLGLTLSGCREQPTRPTGGPVPRIVITPQEAEIAVKDSIRFAVAVYATGNPDPDISWSSEDSSVALVDGDGWVFARDTGETRIHSTATLPDTSVSTDALVTVVPDTTGGS